MFSKFLITAFIVITGTIFGCGKNPTGPEEELVGTWRFVGAAVGDFERYGMPRIEIRFNSDGTWQDDHGGKGTWRTDTNYQLIITDNTGETEEVAYYLDGNDLTFIYTKAQFLRYLWQGGDFSAREIRLIDQQIKPSDTFRIFLRRKS